MIDTFIASFKLKNTYKTNSIIYSLKSIPLIKKLLPSSLYASMGLKKFANIFSILYEIGSVFFGKLLYIMFMIFFVLDLMKSSHADSFVHLFFFLTLVGGFLNTQIFNPTKDKYYAMFLMRMNAKEYTLSSYFYFLFKMVVGFLPFTLIFGLLAGVNVFVCLIMPLFVISVKLIITALTLHDYDKKGKAKNEDMPTAIIFVGVGTALAAAYIPPFFGYAMNALIFISLFAVAAMIAVFAFLYIVKFKEYRSVYKSLLSPDSFVLDKKQVFAKSAQNSYIKKIDVSTNETSTKTGYSYFNELFIKRHSKLLTKSAKRITLLFLGIFTIAIAACLIFPQISANVNDLMLSYLPYFLFIMYFINRGKVVTQAMFMNCDHSMLTYRFYRQPKVIIGLFAARLKSIIFINLMPAIVIAVGLPVLLLITGGTSEPLNYVVLFLSIISMSIFFSVHNMVLYYLLQPYNVNIELKSSTFSIVNFLTYFVCYIAIGKKCPTMLFGSLISVFCIVYIIVALILAYRLAPKTFKLRQ